MFNLQNFPLQRQNIDVENVFSWISYNGLFVFICMLIVVHKLISVKLNWSAPNNLIFFKQKKLEKKRPD